MLPRIQLRGSRLLLFALLICFGCLSALGIPALSAPPIPAPVGVQTALPLSNTSLLQQGIDRYEAQQYFEAIALWQQALSQLHEQPQVQAFTLSNLSLAYQQLGRWSESEIAINQSLALLQDELAPPDILAKALNTQARLQWFQGQPETALETWRRSTVAYQRAGDFSGTLMGLINQAKALQSLGFSVQAEALLNQVQQGARSQSDPKLKVTGLQSLGVALRRVGKLKESLTVLQESSQVAIDADLAALHGSTLLETGNTETALWNKAIAIGQTMQAQSHRQAAIVAYQQAAIVAPSIQLQAQLNHLSLEAEAGQTAAATLLWRSILPQFTQLQPSHSHIYAQLNGIKSLTILQERDRTFQPSWASLAQLAVTAIQDARKLQDNSAESYALGQLGELYEKTGQWTEATSLTEQALLKAEQDSVIRYRWEWQLGRLLEKQSDLSGAIASYTAAVKSLQSIRKDLLLINADIQFSFRDAVEPVYRQLVELLLSATAQPSQEILQQTVQQVNALQLAELENFLGCNVAQTVTITDVANDPTTAKLYPMILQNRLAVVLELPGQSLIYHAVDLPQTAVETKLQTLRENLSTADHTPEAIAGLQEVYQWLIAPFESELAKYEFKTLVFVLDGQLRNVPMAALYDGEQFLISKYATAIAPRLELFQPSPRPKQFNVFLGGVSEPQTLNQLAFPKIEYLTPELEQIQQIAKAKAPLLETDFTEKNIEARLSQENFSAIHLKTHGIFSSDPEETFIVAYRELITGKDLGRLIQTDRQTDRLGESSAVELLVLSACSTAKGDNRAVLGMAGVAVQAGARSVVSTLWEAQDYPNTQLMIRFYQELQKTDITRSQALRNAQIFLIQQGYTTPHIWATYVLVGNWL
ncbi:MAG: CHAT domain-containing protein [Drouetiella hepatica Uher 2000/2452]|jgi:CHAT domain-containing protein|uniref:CHAT domain-containing protein n=1 Tax=Drouetiella hepatica Uher 2000/2452 TaxID=904376 RepID=A0A951QHP5_9CYAN|nr:CHAT domain-containing protein [Drouetiella hepatica Uher 2000/2452]